MWSTYRDALRVEVRAPVREESDEVAFTVTCAGGGPVDGQNLPRVAVGVSGGQAAAVRAGR